MGWQMVSGFPPAWLWSVPVSVVLGAVLCAGVVWGEQSSSNAFFVFLTAPHSSLRHAWGEQRQENCILEMLTHRRCKRDAVVCVLSQGSLTCTAPAALIQGIRMHGRGEGPFLS